MKIYNIHKLIVVFFISTLFLTSCNNDNNDVPVAENTFDGNGLKVLTYAYHEKGVSGKGLSVTTIAEFDTQDTYNNYADDLDNQMDALDDAFVAKWGYLNDDALNAKEEELGFDSEKPLTDFENQIGVQSLRQKYIAAENAWLDNDILDEAKDPDNSSIYDFDESKMALINKLGEVKIGITIVKKLTVKQINDINITLAKSGVKGKSALIDATDGAYLTINDGDFNTLIAYNEGDVSVVNNDNVTVKSGAPAIDCQYNKKKVQTFNLSTTRKIKTKIKVGQPTFGTGNVKAKIVSYKKRNSRGWKKYRTTLTVGLVGDVSDGNCSGYTEHIDKTRTKRRKRLKKKYHNPNFQISHVVENGGMKGVYSQNGVTRQLVLTW